MHLEYCEVKRLYHTHYIHRVSFQHVLVHVFKDDCDKQSLSTLITVIMFLSSMGFFYVFRDYRDKQRLYHTDYIKRVSLQYGFFFYVFGDYCDIQRLYHTDYIHRVSLHYGFFNDFLDNCFVQRLCHKYYIHRVSLQYVFFYVFVDYCGMQRL